MSVELVLILVVVSFAFWVKGVAGFGGPLIAIPLLAPFLGVEAAVVAVVIPNLVANLMMLWTNRHAAAPNRKLLVRLIGAGAIGAIGGTVLLTRLDDRILSVVLAATVLMYIVASLAHPQFRMSRDVGMKLAAPVGLVGGVLHGATGNSGTVFGSFYHSLNLPRDEFVFALTVTFLGFGSLQIATLAQLGRFSGPPLIRALIAILPVLVVVPLGEAVSRRLNANVFGRVVLALLAFSAVALVVGAVS
ncbi:MAG: sulfite exporter TauE/SafE family protein [Acidimicrobiia bacterium]|nr:sulfite exporter TauE/SafE family protein [Acidimicrobiia bacterium]